MPTYTAEQIEQLRAEIQRGREHPERQTPHPSVAHVEVNALAYMRAAEYALRAGALQRALYLAGVAEGIAEALAAVAGPMAPRESVVRQQTARLAASIRERVTHERPEAAAPAQEAEGEFHERRNGHAGH